MPVPRRSPDERLLRRQTARDVIKLLHRSDDLRRVAQEVQAQIAVGADQRAFLGEFPSPFAFDRDRPSGTAAMIQKEREIFRESALAHTRPTPGCVDILYETSRDVRRQAAVLLRECLDVIPEAVAAFQDPKMKEIRLREAIETLSSLSFRTAIVQEQERNLEMAVHIFETDSRILEEALWADEGAVETLKCLNFINSMNFLSRLNSRMDPDILRLLERVVVVVTGIIADNLPAIERILDGPNIEHVLSGRGYDELRTALTSATSVEEGVKAFGILVSKGDETQKQKGLDAMQRALLMLELGAKKDEAGFENAYARALEDLFHLCSDEKVLEVTQSIGRLFSERTEARKVVYHLITDALTKLKKERDPKLWERVKMVLVEMLRPYSFDGEEMLFAWLNSGEEKEWHVLVKSNMEALMALEQDQPGIGRALQEEFGIKVFARYAKDMLIQQYKEKDNVERPYAVILCARNDWNGTFYTGEGELYENLGKSLKGHTSIRFIEATSKTEAVGYLLQCHQKYSAHHRIAFAVLSSHGNTDRFVLGDSSPETKVMQGELDTEMVRALAALFEPGAALIVNSCNTGVLGGIGQELSKVLGLKVICAGQATVLKEVSRKSEGDFDVEYNWDVTAITYERGELQTPIENFGNRLDSLLRVRKMTKTDFAQRVGVHRSTVNRWTKNRADWKNLSRGSKHKITSALTSESLHVLRFKGYSPKEVFAA